MSQHIAYSDELAELMRCVTAQEGKSYRSIARDAQVSPSTIGNMVLGRVPSEDICKRVALAAGVPVVDMLRAAGYALPESLHDRVEMQMRGDDSLPEEGKLQILAFIKETEEKYVKRSGDKSPK